MCWPQTCSLCTQYLMKMSLQCFHHYYYECYLVIHFSCCGELSVRTDWGACPRLSRPPRHKSIKAKNRKGDSWFFQILLKNWRMGCDGAGTEHSLDPCKRRVILCSHESFDRGLGSEPVLVSVTSPSRQQWPSNTKGNARQKGGMPLHTLCAINHAQTHTRAWLIIVLWKLVFNNAVQHSTAVDVVNRQLMLAWRTRARSTVTQLHSICLLGASTGQLKPSTYTHVSSTSKSVQAESADGGPLLIAVDTALRWVSRY